MDFVLFDLLSRGGWVMYPILACSLVAVGFFIERLYALRRVRIIPKNFLQSLGQLLDKNQFQEAELISQNGTTAAARLASTALKAKGQPRSIIKERLEEVGRREAGELQAHLNILGVVVAISPLLGLLGTVSGMINAFNSIASDGIGNPAIMAAGISEALLTTAAGLCVAIPALVAHRFLLNKAENLTADLEDFALYLTEILAGSQAQTDRDPVHSDQKDSENSKCCEPISQPLQGSSKEEA